MPPPEFRDVSRLGDVVPDVSGFRCGAGRAAGLEVDPREPDEGAASGFRGDEGCTVSPPLERDGEELRGVGVRDGEVVVRSLEAGLTAEEDSRCGAAGVTSVRGEDVVDEVGLRVVDEVRLPVLRDPLDWVSRVDPLVERLTASLDVDPMGTSDREFPLTDELLVRLEGVACPRERGGSGSETRDAAVAPVLRCRMWTTWESPFPDGDRSTPRSRAVTRLLERFLSGSLITPRTSIWDDLWWPRPT